MAPRLRELRGVTARATVAKRTREPRVALVHTTLREATDRGFACDHVRDAISTFDPEIRRACERMVGVEGGIWGRVVTVARLEKEGLG